MPEPGFPRDPHGLQDRAFARRSQGPGILSIHAPWLLLPGQQGLDAGAPLIGLNGLVVKVHGNATSKEIGNALIQCVKFKKQKINEKITASLNVEE